jgi:uncharacterized small protein (DUF1192 family)
MEQMIKLSNRHHLIDLENRLRRIQNGEVWGSDHLGPYTPKEKSDEIARIEAEIIRLKAEELS